MENLATAAVVSHWRDFGSWYLENGWAVFPLNPGRKLPMRLGLLRVPCADHPFAPEWEHLTAKDCRACKGSHLAAQTDPAWIDYWWARWATCNVGVRPPSGVVVIDLDGADAVSGFLQTLGQGCFSPGVPEPVFGALGMDVDALLAETFTVRTPGRGGGLHIYWRVPDGVRLRNSLPFGWGEIKTSRGYLVGAGSTVSCSRGPKTTKGKPTPCSTDCRDQSHRAYTPSRFDRLVVAEMPLVIAEFVAGSQEADRLVSKSRAPTHERVWHPGEGIYSLSPEVIASWATDVITSAPVGFRRHTLFAVACELGRAAAQFGLPEATRVLEQAASASGLTDDEAERHITNGLAQGTRDIIEETQ